MKMRRTILRYKRSLNLGQTIRHRDSRKKTRTNQIVDFAVPADPRMKIKEREKTYNHLDFA